MGRRDEALVAQASQEIKEIPVARRVQLGGHVVEQQDRRFYATDLGEVVSDKLTEAFPEIMDVGYTRQMEAALDEVEENRVDWVEMLRDFYSKFSVSLARAHEDLKHAKAEIQPAPYKCPQ